MKRFIFIILIISSLNAFSFSLAKGAEEDPKIGYPKEAYIRNTIKPILTLPRLKVLQNENGLNRRRN